MNGNRNRRSTLGASALALALCTALIGCSGPDKPAPGKPSAGATMPHQAAAPVEAPATLEAAVAGSWRTPAYVASDVYRNPAKVLAFFGVGKTSRVAEIGQDPGYYGEILSPYLRDGGQYVGIPYDGQDLQKAFDQRPTVFSGAIARTLSQKPEQAADPVGVVIVNGGVDKWVAAGNAESMFQGLHSILAPGGILGVVQARARGETHQDGKSGYLSEKQVVFLAELAGFQLVEWSEISSNPLDSRDYPEGVDVLPPVLKLGDVDREKYLAIGEADRMTLKFVKRGE